MRKTVGKKGMTVFHSQTSSTRTPPTVFAKMLYSNAMIAPQMNPIMANMIGNMMMEMTPNASTDPIPGNTFEGPTTALITANRIP